MGQRHQIYVIMPYEVSLEKEGKDGSKKFVNSNIVGIHHQWLFGITAVEYLYQFLEFVRKSKRNYSYSVFSENGYANRNPEKVVESLYTVLFKDGGFHAVEPLDFEESTHPEYGDNNDGITIIDTRGKKPKYAMMFIGAGGEYDIEHYKVINALDYMHQYYGDKVLEESESWKAREELFRKSQEYTYKLAKKVDKYELLTDDEVKTVFPSLFEEANISL